MSAAPGRLAALALMTLALVSACSNGGTGSESPRASNTATTTSTTGTAEDSTTSTSGPGPERIEVSVVRLFQSRNDAFRQPDPALVDAYLSPGCTCYEQERATLENLRSRGWHWETLMFELLGVRVVEHDRPNLATLTVVARRPPERVVDASGALVKPEGPGQDPVGYSVLLVQRDGEWRIGDNTELDLRPDLLDEIIRAGIPS